MLQDAGHPSLLLSRSAFSEVILGHRARVEGVPLPHRQCQEGKVVLHLKCWWVSRSHLSCILTFRRAVKVHCTLIHRWGFSSQLADYTSTTN